jgi:hypothetical protein
MAGDDLLCIVDQDRIAEPELLDAVCDLPDLALRMRSGIVGVRPQLASKRIFNFHRNSSSQYRLFLPPHWSGLAWIGF